MKWIARRTAAQIGQQLLIYLHVMCMYQAEWTHVSLDMWLCMSCESCKMEVGCMGQVHINHIPVEWCHGQCVRCLLWLSQYDYSQGGSDHSDHFHGVARTNSMNDLVVLKWKDKLVNTIWGKIPIIYLLHVSAYKKPNPGKQTWKWMHASQTKKKKSKRMFTYCICGHVHGKFLVEC